jgi:hypothetical protein
MREKGSGKSMSNSADDIFDRLWAIAREHGKGRFEQDALDELERLIRRAVDRMASERSLGSAERAVENLRNILLDAQKYGNARPFDRVTIGDMRRAC